MPPEFLILYLYMLIDAWPLWIFVIGLNICGKWSKRREWEKQLERQRAQPVLDEAAKLEIRNCCDIQRWIHRNYETYSNDQDDVVPIVEAARQHFAELGIVIDLDWTTKWAKDVYKWRAIDKKDS